MKFFCKTILKYYLKYVTKIVLAVHRPTIVAISGSSNKTFIRDEIRKILKEKGKTVRANPKNFNTEIGLPLAILNVESGYNSYRAWLPIIAKSFLAIFQKNFPEYLVLELGVSQKGDMRYLLSIVRPRISIISEINQRYVESFSGMDNLFLEYAYLARRSKKDGALILNYDNARVRNLSKKTRARVEFFGKTDAPVIFQIEKIEKQKNGQKFWLKHNNKTQEFFVPRFGEHNVYSCAAGKVFEYILNIYELRNERNTKIKE
ncbi:MAG: Mur ligase family protein [Candidatus Moraniibacteriota bacterium]